MKASVYYGKGDIRIESVPDPEIKDPTDALVRITVLEMSVDLQGVPEGYAAMDSRQKIKVMVRP